MKNSGVYMFVLLSVLIFMVIGCGSNTNKVEVSELNNGRFDSWQILGLGGGGAQFNQAVSPLDPNLAFSSCDMGGAYITYNGGESWRMFNLPSNSRFCVFDPNDINTIYVSTRGLFKSEDKGKTWRLIYPAASEVSGMISKGDHAAYIYLTKDNTISQVEALTVDPDNSLILYAAISVDGVYGLFTSENGGTTWNFEKELTAGITNIFIDPSSPKEDRTLYLTGNKGIQQRVNGNWTINNLPQGVGLLNLYSGGYSKDKEQFVIYAISGTSYFNPETEKSGIFITTDGGVNWENRQDGILSYLSENSEMPEWRTIATSANYPNMVYVSYNNLRTDENNVCIGVAKSEDYGVTWDLVWKDSNTPNGQVVSANFSEDWTNDRFGPSWGENPFSIGVGPNNPEVCYTGDFGRTIKTIDGGKTWQQVYSQKVSEGYWTSRGLDVTTSYSVVIDPNDENHIFVPTTDIGLVESKDGGKSWRSATKDNGVPRNWANTTYWMVYDPEVKGRAWTVMSNKHDIPRPKMFRRTGIEGYMGGVLITEDNGETWTPVSDDIGQAAMTHIFLDTDSPVDARTLYACAFGKGVYKSVDGGKSWQQKNNGIEGNEPFAWQISQRKSDGTLFLVVSRRSDDGSIGDERDGAVYKSNDGAETWVKMTLPEGTNGPTTVSFGSESSSEIILSAWGKVEEGKFSPDTGGGIFISSDDGKTWEQVLQNDQHISAVTYDSRNNRFYACGFNSSAYYSEDNARTWNRIKGYNFKWGQRVEPDPRDPEKILINTFGGGVWYGPAKGDPSAIEDVVEPILY